MGPCHRGGNWDWDPDQRHSSSCHRAFFSCGSAIGNKGCISVEQIPADLQMLTHFTGPMLPNQLFVSQLEIFHGGNFCRSVFLVLLYKQLRLKHSFPSPRPHFLKEIPWDHLFSGPTLQQNSHPLGEMELGQSLGPSICSWSPKGAARCTWRQFSVLRGCAEESGW